MIWKDLNWVADSGLMSMSVFSEYNVKNSKCSDVFWGQMVKVGFTGAGRFPFSPRLCCSFRNIPHMFWPFSGESWRVALEAIDVCLMNHKIFLTLSDRTVVCALSDNDKTQMIVIFYLTFTFHMHVHMFLRTLTRCPRIRSSHVLSQDLWYSLLT